MKLYSTTPIRCLICLFFGLIALLATRTPLAAQAISAAPITLEKAVAVALLNHPGGQVIEAELDHDDGWFVYKIQLSNGAKVQIDASSGTLLGVELDDASLWANGVKTTLQQATTAALASYPGTAVIEAKLDNDDGWLVYTLSLSNGLKVYVDASNSTVLGTKGFYQNSSGAQTATISAQVAQQTAEATYPYAGMASRVKLKVEYGRLIYKVEFFDEGQVIIDATTGAVLGQEVGKAGFVNRNAQGNPPAAAPVAIDAARQAAQAIHNGQIKKVELDYELGKLVYVIKFFDGMKVLVDAASGTVLGQEGKNGQFGGGLGTGPAITIQAAQQAAEKHLGMGMAKKVELENNYGRLVYKVEFANNTKVMVDGTSGAVLGVEYDD